MIKFHIGDLMTHTTGIIVHQVNCQGVMGSGVAKLIRARYPKVYGQYSKFCMAHRANYDLLGKVQVVRVSDTLSVANIFGQLNYGTDQIQVDYWALESGFRKMFILDPDQKEYHVPDMIGCGLAGGDRNRVIELISKSILTVNPDAVVNVWRLP